MSNNAVKKLSLSIRSVIYYIIVLMGILAIALTALSVRWYRSVVLEEQQESLALLAKHAVGVQLRQHEGYLYDLGLTMQSDPDFAAAFTQGESATLQYLINDQFHQYFTTTGMVDLKQILLFDTEFHQIMSAAQGAPTRIDSGGCTIVLKRALARSGVDRFKNLSGMCTDAGTPYQMVIVPIGGLRLKGYAAILANPVHAFRHLDDVLGIPFEVMLPSGENVFSSPNWDARRTRSDFIVANYTVPAETGEGLLTISVRSGIEEINKELFWLTLNIAFLALAVTFIVILITMWIFKGTIIKPLQRLNDQMARIRTDKSALSEQITITGCKELNNLATQFNRMATELANAQSELMQQAHTDELTGLANRFLFYDRLADLVEYSDRTGAKFALLMTDLNKFKDVNDTLGHHAGDELIKQIGERLSGQLRRSDIVARLGGDEFAMLLPTTGSLADAAEACKKIVSLVEEPYTIFAHTVSIGISIGIALYPDTADDPEALMHCADKGMYHAKQNGLGSYYCPSPCNGKDCHLERGTCGVRTLP